MRRGSVRFITAVLIVLGFVGFGTDRASAGGADPVWPAEIGLTEGPAGFTSSVSVSNPADIDVRVTPGRNVCAVSVSGANR